MYESQRPAQGHGKPLLPPQNPSVEVFISKGSWGKRLLVRCVSPVKRRGEGIKHPRDQAQQVVPSWGAMESSREVDLTQEVSQAHHQSFPSLLSAETRSVGAHHLRDDRKPQVAHPFQRLCAVAACAHAAFLARERKCLFLGVTTWPFSRVRRTCSGRQAGRPAEQALTSRCHCILKNRF